MRFCFTIRDLLWLTALMPLAVGWGFEHRSKTPGRYDAYIRCTPPAIISAVGTPPEKIAGRTNWTAVRNVIRFVS